MHDGVFELDGDTQASSQDPFDNDNDPDTANVNPNVDWESLFHAATATEAALDDSSGDLVKTGDVYPNSTLPTNFLAKGGAPDYALPDKSTYATGSKDTLPVSGWQCSKSNNVGDKVDIVNSYATAYLDTTQSPPHLILYYGVEKSSPTGDSNIAVWFLKDGTVDCSASTGGAKTWSGGHTDGDILLVSAFTNGGGTANVNAYRWNGDDATGSLGTSPIESGQLCGTGDDDACSVTNNSAITPPWLHPDKDGGALNAQEFFEGGVDMGPFGADSCFATAVTNTRSSQSLTATLFDFDRFSLPVCGKLDVIKYIDADLSGTNNAGDTNSGSDVAGYAFSVSGPSPSTAVVCSGTTRSTDGKLVCSTGSLENLLPGTYSITETQKTGFFNTDAADNTPDPTINEASSVTGTATVGIAGGTVKFGNTCFVAKTFEITSVPATVGSVTVEYRVMAGSHATATYTSLALDAPAAGSTTWSKTVSNAFNQNDTIAWRWYINGDSAHKVTGASEASPESLSGNGYNGTGLNHCAKVNSDSLDLVTLEGFKYKDVNGNGTIEATDNGLGGWQFTLKRVLGDNGTPADPSDDPLSAVLDTQSSSSVAGANLGRYQFQNVAPGTYRIFEESRTGWVQTVPSSPSYRQVTVVLGDTSPVSAGNFLNTPTARIDIDVSSLATLPGGGDAMKASSISCVNTAGNTNTANLTDGDSSDNGYNSGSVRAGSYTCTVVIIDP